MELSELMADAARELQGREDSEEVMDRAVRLAVQDIEGCKAAALSIVRRKGRIETIASTNRTAQLGDELQYETREGPCLDAIRHARVVEVPDMSQETRWPTWSKLMAEQTGVASMMCVQLFTEAENVGALNMYSYEAAGFSAEDQEYGMALAAHISVAIRSAQRIDSLGEAMDSRTVIGTAVGLIMGRYNLDQATAFGVLNRLASTSQTKVRVIAEQVIATRAIPAPDVVAPEK